MMDWNDEINKICAWIKGIVGDKYVVIGLSGGVDSAVVASLCVKALGKDKVVGAMMPCGSVPLDEKLAVTLAQKLDIGYRIYHLDAAYEAMMFTMHPRAKFQLVQGANVKARLRMVTLYAIANACNGMVAGTGNKSEHMVGYFTKYGDGGTDFEPICDYYKTEVWEMARALGDIPQEIIDRPPSAGLWEGQTDEGELGITYAKLDEMLKTIETGSILHSAIGIDDYRRVMQMCANSEHKRLTPPYYHRK